MLLRLGPPLQPGSASRGHVPHRLDAQYCVQLRLFRSPWAPRGDRRELVFTGLGLSRGVCCLCVAAISDSAAESCARACFHFLAHIELDQSGTDRPRWTERASHLCIAPCQSESTGMQGHPRVNAVSGRTRANHCDILTLPYVALTTGFVPWPSLTLIAVANRKTGLVSNASLGYKFNHGATHSLCRRSRHSTVHAKVMSPLVQDSISKSANKVSANTVSAEALCTFCSFRSLFLFFYYSSLRLGGLSTRDTRRTEP